MRIKRINPRARRPFNPFVSVVIARTAARELYQRQIDTIDAQIDALVYELYGLTEEEIRVVEESVTRDTK